MQEIVDLVARGTREVVLVAQDTIRYGADLGIKHGLPYCWSRSRNRCPNLPWVRLLYIYPTVLTLRMVDVHRRARRAAAISRHAAPARRPRRTAIDEPAQRP